MAVLEKGHLQLFGPADGLRAGIYQTIVEDREHVIWLGGSDGLSRAEGMRFVTVRTEDSFAGEISSIAEDAAGYLWLATSPGIIRMEKAEFEKAVRTPSHRIRHTAYDRADGLAGTPQARYGIGQRAIRAADGRLWFVTGSGVSIIDPGALNQPRRSHPVQLEAIVVDNVRIPAVNHAMLPPRTSKIQIDYTTLNLTSSRKTQFRYRLDGVDDDWIDAGSRQEAFYTNLTPRQYRFSVMATDDENGWNASPAVVEFSIEPMFYQSVAFVVFCGVVLVATLSGLWALRVRRLRQAFALVIAERLRLSREIHDTLLQGLVGVALQFEAMASHVSSPSARVQFIRVRERIDEYIREARQAISDLRQPPAQAHELVDALRREVDHVAGISGLKVDFNVTGTPVRCSLDVEQQLLRIAREAVMNAVRHARATHVRVALHYERAQLKLGISDDGCGFDAAASDKTVAHYGLIGITERARSVGGVMNVESRAGAGTSLEAVIPVLGLSPGRMT
jgi:signal transduction histidine kinase